MTEAFFRRVDLCRSRVRAFSWRLRGASIDQKVSIGIRARVDHPKGVSIGHRSTLESDVWLKLVGVNALLSIGEGTFLGRGTELDVAQQITLGANVLIAPGVFITDHTHNFRSHLPIHEQGCTSDPVVIEEGAWIGARAIILPGVRIGAGAVVGAGSVVRSSIPDQEIWAGVPAKKIGIR